MVFYKNLNNSLKTKHNNKSIKNENNHTSPRYYDIKIGEKSFFLSSESLNNDAPNFFTAAFFGYFQESNTSKIFIERDPTYFDMIVRYLRGYEVDWPFHDKTEMKNLLADVRFYGFGNLQIILEEVFEQNFPKVVIPWKIITYAPENEPVLAINIKDVELRRWDGKILIYDTNPILKKKINISENTLTDNNRGLYKLEIHGKDAFATVTSKWNACIEIDNQKYHSYNDLSAYFGTTKGKPLYFEELVIRIDRRVYLMRAKAWTAPSYYASRPFIQPANNLCNKVLKKSSVSGGCINSAFKLSTDSGDFFVKTNNSLDYDTLVMFKGEMVALNTISSSVPDFAPKALHAASFKDGGAFLVTTFINLKSSSSSKHDVLFAKKLALLHSTNSPDNRFGFPVVTMCGATEQDNTWESDWETFYKERRLKFIIDKCLKKYPSNKELKELGKVVVDKVVHHLLKDIEVKSSLIHGDLWSGNWGIDSDTNEPVIYDPAAYYAHNEMELSILTMFGSPSKEFFDEYHKHHPRQKPFFKERQGI
nr:13399_t:CDS:2 [Entrophospora candida]